MPHRKVKIADELCHIMPRIARVVTASFVHTVDLPHAQLFLLLTLQDHGPSRVCELSQAMEISAPTVTGILDRLEKVGYVRRRPDTADRRVINITLTPSGLRTAEKVRQGAKARWQAILEQLSPEDCETYLRIVKTIQEQLEKEV